MPTAHQIDRVVVLSTEHLTSATREAMNGMDAPITYANAYGAFIYVPTSAPPPGVDVSHIPPDLLECLEYARKLDCRWIKFDDEGPVMSDLASYENVVDDDPDRCAKSPDGVHSFANTSIADVGEDTGEGMYRCTWCGEGET